MTTDIYIISLASAVHRRAFQATQAKRLGFEPVWCDATSVQDISEDFFYRHAFQWQRALKKTEVACFMSHFQLWQKIASSNRPAVVLEDDVVLGCAWTDQINTLTSYSNADFICLEAWGKKTLGKSDCVGNLQLRELLLNSAGAAAYILWPTGARHLLARYERDGVALADAFINQTQGWRIWQLIPANAIQMNVAPEYGLSSLPNSESLIAREHNPSATAPSHTIKYIMKWRRFKCEMKKAWILISLSFKHKRKYIPYLHHEHE
jgi:glycosyl transferase family 25